ncbi:hypothetical protein B5X24_HaOG216524 [Helicoverpa armigera]|nr:hypothetical protein B5X24_HaOG216524 [Helicoverpa armigera]
MNSSGACGSGTSMCGAKDSGSSEVAAVGVPSRIPEFWIDMPRVWFAQFETVMAPQKQGDEAKYGLVLSKLSTDAVRQVTDIIISPPATRKYEALKERLLAVYEESEERQFQKLVGEVELGDQKPSQLLRRMRDLARKSQVAEKTLHNLWMSRLPDHVRAVLMVSQDQKLDNLAAIADKILEGKSSEVSEISSGQTQLMAELMHQMTKLTMEVAALKSSSGHRSYRRNRIPTRSRSRSRTRITPDSPNWLYVLAEYPNISKPFDALSQPKHNVVHQIITSGHPVYSKARPLPADKYLRVKKEIEHMVEIGICRPSKSPWSSPLHVTTKKTGELRLCGDYRRLNAITVPDRYPIPRVLDFTYILPGTSIYSKIDLKRAYNQIPVQDIEKTAVITPFGLFEFPRMPFGLRNAGQTFVRFLNTVLAGLDFIFVYIDDILVTSSSTSEHRRHLHEVFRRLDEHGISINQAKCVLGKPKVEFLGYLITKDGIKPLPDKVEAIHKYPLPRTVQELRRFLGMINFYRSSIPQAAKHQACLNKYLTSSKKADKTEIQWTPEATEAFDRCKASLSDAVTLTSPSPHAPLSLMTDASQTCVGAVLQQYENGSWKPLSFFSKGLSETQSKYSTYDRELLAIYMAITHFQPYVEGRELIVYTDHKPLCHAFTTKHDTSNKVIAPRRIRHLEFIAQFTTDIRHLAGNLNPVADALSRVEQIDCPTPVNWNEIADMQRNDTELAQLLNNKNLIWKTIQLSGARQLFCEKSRANLRPYVPKLLRKEVFDSMHNITHPGVRSSKKMISEHYFWPRMNTDVGTWAKTCEPCQKSKVHRHNSSPIGSFADTARLEHVHIDIVGPLAESSGKRYIITMIDRETRWPEAVPVAEITAKVVAEVFLNTWIARFGCPNTITTDQGRQFESDLFIALTKSLGIKKTRTTSYHPQSNGLVERWHRTMKTALIARGNTTNWSSELPLVLLGLRAAIRVKENVSPAQMLFGTNIRLPGVFVEPKTRVTAPETFAQVLQSAMANLSPFNNNHHATSHKPFIHPDMKDCEYVYVRTDAVKKPLTPPYEGPFKVLEKHEKHFKIQMPKKTSIVSVDRLKPAYILIEEKVNKPLERSDSSSSQVNNRESVEPAGNNKVTPTITRSGRVSRPVVRFAIQPDHQK